MPEIMLNPIVKGIINGVLVAAAVDFHAFMSWKSAEEAASYSWRTAFFRWLQGAVYGAITAGGYTALLG